MNKRTTIITLIVIVVALIGYYAAHEMSKQNGSGNTTTSTSTESSMRYTNAQYRFTFSLPQTWKGYSVVTNTWKANTGTEQGPLLSIRNPKWTPENKYQDIPIMVFTIVQWRALQRDQFHIGAAPINPSELGRNNIYVFALPARYNFAAPTGWEEVQSILETQPLHAF